MVLALFSSTALACGAERIPTPPYVRQPTEALSIVSYPPPPSRVETIPPRPERGAVWVDGEWTWQARRWAWRRGRWVVPPRGASFSPWTVVRDSFGTLYFAPGAWRDAQGGEVPEPPAIAEAGAVRVGRP